jgi:hypothetical protein
MPGIHKQISKAQRTAIDVVVKEYLDNVNVTKPISKQEFCGDIEELVDDPDVTSEYLYKYIPKKFQKEMSKLQVNKAKRDPPMWTTTGLDMMLEEAKKYVMIDGSSEKHFTSLRVVRRSMSLVIDKKYNEQIIENIFRPLYITEKRAGISATSVTSETQRVEEEGQPED